MAPPSPKLAGTRHGTLTVVGLSERRDSYQRPLWECVCDCGAFSFRNASDVQKAGRNGRGCKHCFIPDRLELSGQRFGLYTVLHVAPPETRPPFRDWVCRCDCGREHIRTLANLRQAARSGGGCVECASGRGVLQQRNDLVGRVFGDVKVVSLNRVSPNKQEVFWNCVDLAGNERVFSRRQLARIKHPRCDGTRFPVAVADMAGRKFHMLTVIGEEPRDKRGNRRFTALCDCGATVSVAYSAITSGGVRSCGCLKALSAKRRLEKKLLGKVYGRLTIVEIVPKPAHRKGSDVHFVRCVCSCGNSLVVAAKALYSGNTSSCGCLNTECLKARVGPAHPNYDPALTDAERNARYDREHEARVWRKKVWERDHYVCQACGTYSGHLNAHHIKSWRHFPGLRFAVRNGVTLCKACHDDFHGRHGSKRTSEGNWKYFVPWLREYRGLYGTALSS